MAKENSTPAKVAENKPASTEAAAAKPKQVRKPKKAGPTKEELEAEQAKLDDAFIKISDAMRMAADAVDSYKKMILNTKDVASSNNRELMTEDDKKADLKRKRAEKRAKKDPNAPKRPTTGFLDFQNEVREKYKQDYPDLDNKERVKLIAEAWKTMEASHKEIYTAKAKGAMDEWKIDTAKYKGELNSSPVKDAREAVEEAEEEDEEEEEEDSDAATQDGSSESGSSESESEEEAPAPVPVKKSKPASTAAASKPKSTPKAKETAASSSDTPASAKKAKKDTKAAPAPAEKKQKTKK